MYSKIAQNFAASNTTGYVIVSQSSPPVSLDSIRYDQYDDAFKALTSFPLGKIISFSFYQSHASPAIQLKDHIGLRPQKKKSYVPLSTHLKNHHAIKNQSPA